MSSETKNEPSKDNMELSDERLDEANGGVSVSAGDTISVHVKGKNAQGVEFGPSSASGSSGGDAVPMEQFSLRHDERDSADPTSVKGSDG